MKALVLALSLVVLAVGLAVAQTGGVPFGVDKRPMPTGTSLETLVPPTVGSFKRDALPAGAKARSDEDLNVTYRSGSDSVNFGFSIPDSINDAREAVKLARDEATGGTINIKGASYSITTDPAYFHSGDFMSWARGRYFFYAKANNAKALEAFMRAFPY